MFRNENSRSPVSLSVVLSFSIVFCSCSCRPVINSFKVTAHDTVEVRRMTADDTLRVNWDVKGKPTLLVHESELPDSAGKVIEMKLVVEKGGKEVNRVVQVEVVPKNATTSITFETSLSANGDTLIADDEKNPGVWGDRFEVFAVLNASNRQLIVWHANRTAALDKSGAPSNAFAGTPLEGRWIFKSLLTAAEKANHSLLPQRLQINTTIAYKRRQ